jgi:5-formyltetrahydrofolate cyclo-ligase
MATSVRLLKRQLRKEILQNLGKLSSQTITEESSSRYIKVYLITAERCMNTIVQLPQFAKSRNVSIYVSMPSKELQTHGLLENAFKTGKRVFIPFIDGPIMQMVESPSYEDIKNLPPNNWGIPEPTSSEGRLNGVYSHIECGLITALQGDGLDLIVVPGVAFDRDMNRIGHGKGYYDHFFQRCFEYAKQRDRPPPTLGIS